MPLPTNAGKTTFYHPIFKPAKSSDVRAAARTLPSADWIPTKMC